MHKFVRFAAACALLLAASSVNAATYVASRAVGAGSVNLSITTDNTMGVLGVGNILDWKIAVSDGTNSFVFQGPGGANNSTYHIEGGQGLTATATDLTFDFGRTSDSAAGFVGPRYSTYYYGWQAKPWIFNGGPAEAMHVGTFNNVQHQPYSGIQIIASVAPTGGVPEASVWALMIAGFGVVGGALRRRRHVAVA